MSGFSVKKWREIMGFSRKQAAEKLEISPHTIKSYELLKRELPAPLEKLMRRLEREKNGPLGSVAGASIKILGGGTLLPIKQGLALTAVSSGHTAQQVLALCQAHDKKAELLLTHFADPTSSIQTIFDTESVARSYIADKKTKVVFWNPTVVDYPDYTFVLANEDGDPILSTPVPSPHKIPRLIKDKRPDVFLVCFQTTSGNSEAEMYEQAVKLLCATHANLVFAKDSGTGLNMVVSSERSVYHQTCDKEVALAGLVEMSLSRSQSRLLKPTLVSEKQQTFSPSDEDVFVTVAETCVLNGLSLLGVALRTENGWMCNSDKTIAIEDAVALNKNEKGEWLANGGRPHCLGLNALDSSFDCMVLFKDLSLSGEEIDARLFERSTDAFSSFLNQSLLNCSKPYVKLDNGHVYMAGSKTDIIRTIKNLLGGTTV